MISKKCTYAIKAVLALARRHGAGPMTIQQIAEAQDIPARFLEAILRDLKQNGFTESIRGKEGGYLLSRPPREISLGEVIRAMEGPLLQGDSESAVFAEIWAEASRRIDALLDPIDFQELLRREDLRRQVHIHDYTI